MRPKARQYCGRSPLTAIEQTNWQQREAKFEPLFNDARARWAGVTREDVVRGIKQSLEGWNIGVFNQENEALPIVLRVKQDEVPGSDIAALRGVQIRPANGAETVPLDQVIDGVSIRWEDPIVWHRDRKRTITLQANPIRGVTLPTYMQSLAPQIGGIDQDHAARLPDGMGRRIRRLDQVAGLARSRYRAGSRHHAADRRRPIQLDSVGRDHRADHPVLRRRHDCGSAGDAAHRLASWRCSAP